MKPVLYMYLHSRLWGYKKEMSEKELKIYLCKGWRVPKLLVPLIIKEFQELGYIKKEKRNQRNPIFLVSLPEFNEDKINELYEKFKIF